MSDKDWGDDSALMIFGGNLEKQPEAFQKKFNELTEKAGNRVRFYGSYRSAELPSLMKDVDWLIIPSIWWENSPVVIQEAFLHGRPIIASNIGGMAEVWRGKQFGASGFERLVAIKRILPNLVEDDEFVRMFIDEATICGRL